MIDHPADRGLQTVGIGHVGAYRDRVVAGEMRGFLAGRGTDLRDRYLGAFARKADSGGTADASTGTGDKRNLAGETIHGGVPPWSAPNYGLSREERKIGVAVKFHKIFNTEDERGSLSTTSLSTAPPASRIERVSPVTFQRNNLACRFYEARGLVLIRQTDSAENAEKEPAALYLWNHPAPVSGNR